MIKVNKSLNNRTRYDIGSHADVEKKRTNKIDIDSCSVRRLLGILFHSSVPVSLFHLRPWKTDIDTSVDMQFLFFLFVLIQDKSDLPGN